MECIVQSHKESLASKLSKQEQDLLERYQMEAAAALTEKIKESEEISDNLIKHVRIVEQLADMHQAELGALEEQATQKLYTSRVFKRVTSAFEEKISALEQELDNMKGLLEEERHAKHLAQQQVPSLEEKYPRSRGRWIAYKVR